MFNLSSFTIHWALAFPLAALWLVLRPKAFLGSKYVLVGLVAGTLLAWAGGSINVAAWWWLPSAILVALSSAVLLHIIGDTWQRFDRIQTGLVLWLLIGASAALYVQLPPKVLVPSAPAMALIAAQQLKCNALNIRQAVVVLTCIAGLILGILIVRADTTLAEVGRIGGRVAGKYVREGRRTWMDGRWGFQWYAMEAGAEPMAETAPFPMPDDIVVAGPGSRLVYEMFPAKTLLSRQVFSRPGGRVNGDGAGFFTNLAGPWPWVWGKGEIGRIEVWRIDSLPIRYK
jgi:hypothetical protein